MSPIKDFVTKAKKRQDGRDDRFTFRVDGVEIASLRPTEDQLALLMVAYSSDVRDESNRIANMIDGSLALYDPDSQRYFQRRLLVREDDFGLEDFMEITQGVIEEWGNRPTRRSYDSIGSPPTNGTSSTAGASVVDSTSSDFPSPTPAMSSTPG